MAKHRPVNQDTDKFALLLSQGLNRKQVRERMNISNGTFCRLLDKLREDLGWQAQ